MFDIQTAVARDVAIVFLILVIVVGILVWIF